ncbi:MAG: DNA alkylation repair protein [Anaerovoracaceae bacterium]
MNHAETEIQKRLMDLKDEDYKKFHCGLMPGVDPERVIGVRTPQLRKLAADIMKQQPDLAEEFLHSLPHTYYDENNVHGFLIAGRKDFQQCVGAIEAFLPYVDNWATCDLIRPKVFSKHLEELLPYIERWLASDHTYTIRFGIRMLMDFYLDDAFETRYADMVAAVRSEAYYVNMASAWYFATALAKQYDAVLPYIETRRLDTWTHNKAIQKAVESYRITPEQKAYLKGLKRKQNVTL